MPITVSFQHFYDVFAPFSPENQQFQHHLEYPSASASPLLLPPYLNPDYMFVPTEESRVLDQPFPLAVVFARTPACGFIAELLVIAVAVVRCEPPPAMLTFQLFLLDAHKHLLRVSDYQAGQLGMAGLPRKRAYETNRKQRFDQCLQGVC